MDVALLRELLLFLLLYFLVRRFLCQILPGAARRLPPGPPGYPIVGALPLLGQAPHKALAGFAKRYGPIMYLKMGRQKAVVASAPDAARLFLKTFGTAFCNRPVDAAPVRLAYGAQDLVFAEDGPKWKLLRKVCSMGLLGPQALEEWAGIRRAEMGLMVKSIWASSQRNKPIEIGELLFFAMANMIGQVILSRRVLDDESAGETKEFKEMVVELMTTAGLVNIGDYVPAVAWMDLQGLERKMRRLQRRLDALWSRLVAEHEHGRAQAGKTKVDLLDRLVACRDGGEGEERLTDVNIKAVLNDLFTAGTDTSSSTIEWALAEMLLNPDILKRAQREMDDVIGRDRLLQESDIPRLPYLRAICKEAFRKHPSTPLNLPHVSTEACDVQGYHIPKGTRLIVNIWAIGRDPDVWKDPAKFDPERFMTSDGMKIEPTGNHFELIPFGAGRRMCAGARMGVLLVQYILGTLVHAFDWELPEGVVMDMEEAFGLALQKAVPVTAVVRPRLAESAYA